MEHRDATITTISELSEVGITGSEEFLNSVVKSMGVVQNSDYVWSHISFDILRIINK